MARILAILLVAAMLGGAIFTYDNKHRAELAGERVAMLRGQLNEEKSAISLLRAEWSVLTQPSRLQMLSERFKTELGLAPAEVSQMVSISEIPIRPPATAPEIKPPVPASRPGRQGGA